MVKPIVSGPYRTFRALTESESYIEYEGSTITIPMQARRSPSELWLEETVKLHAFMRLEIYPPYINNLGTREFQFTIRDWDLYGKSPMLNQLFFDDPRGRLVVNEETGLADYVPAVVSFKVSHNYKLGFHPSVPDEVKSAFGSDADIEIRNLTSHHLSAWAEYEEQGTIRHHYSNPGNRIYWQIISPAKIKQSPLAYVTEDARRMGVDDIDHDRPMMVFHKKMPDIPGSTGEFDIANPVDRARYMLAVAHLAPVVTKSPSGRNAAVLQAAMLGRGHESSLTQLRGNTVVSSVSRSRDPLEIRIPLNSRLESRDELGTRLEKAFSDGKVDAIGGWIQITSPARSLGTADQAPEPGEPGDSADFPARITYAVNYDIFINRERFVQDQAGIAIAVGAKEVPPRDVKVAFEKPQFGLVASKFLRFSSGDCTGMAEIPREAYHEGMNFARYWRTVPLVRDEIQLFGTAAPSGFEDYDPNRIY